MEQFDSETFKRVWARVQAGTAPAAVQSDVAILAAREAAESAVYLRLSRFLQGHDREILRRIAIEDKGHWGILRGILRMTAEAKPQTPPPLRESGPIGHQLRLCYGRKQQMVAEYEKRIADPQFGRIFQKLADAENTHCQALLILIGKY